MNTSPSPTTRRTPAATRNLTVDAVARQAEEIAALRERHPGLTVLHGCEVDILADGRLDFRDAILERFDIVLASLHERHGHSSDQLLARYVSAMRHPLVSMVTHPTNRLIPYRPACEPRLRSAVRNRRRDEDAHRNRRRTPHLDLDGALARRAIAAGATVAIDSDCHRAEMLGRQMQFGIMTARRGWVEARHVVNTRPSRGGPRVHRRQTPPLGHAGHGRRVRRARRIPSLPGDAAAGLRSRRHRVVPDDGRAAEDHAARRLSAVLRHRRASSSPSSGARPTR